MTAPDGTPINAVRGLLDFIARLVTDRQPTRLVAAMDDDWRPAFRVDALPSYKAHRVATGDEEEVPDALTPQVAIIEDVLDALGIACFGVDGYEADDVIGTLATRDPGPVDVVTGDRDLFQLVDDERAVRVLYTARGRRPRRGRSTRRRCTAKYGIPGRAYADFATLRGDPSDGLPGVPGVGDKTAAALITTLRLLPGAARGARRRRPRRCPPVPGPSWPPPATTWRSPRGGRRGRGRAAARRTTTTLPRSPRDPDRLVELSQRWGLDSPLNRVLSALHRGARREPDRAAVELVTPRVASSSARLAA